MLTPTIITADQLARSAEAEIAARHPRPMPPLAVEGPSPRDPASRPMAGAPRPARPPRESDRVVQGRFSRARYEALEVLSRSGRGGTRAAGGHGGVEGRAETSTRPTAGPGLSLQYRARPGEGRVPQLVQSTGNGPVSREELVEAYRAASSHMTQAFQLAERAQRRGLSPERRTRMLRTAAAHAEQGLRTRDWVTAHSRHLTGKARERIDAALSRPTWREHSEYVLGVMNNYGVATR